MADVNTGTSTGNEAVVDTSCAICLNDMGVPAYQPAAARRNEGNDSNDGDGGAHAQAQAVSGRLATFTLQCGHTFHVTCAWQALRGRDACPTCRAPEFEAARPAAPPAPPVGPPAPRLVFGLAPLAPPPRPRPGFTGFGGFAPPPRDPWNTLGNDDDDDDWGIEPPLPGRQPAPEPDNVRTVRTVQGNTLVIEHLAHPPPAPPPVQAARRASPPPIPTAPRIPNRVVYVPSATPPAVQDAAAHGWLDLGAPTVLVCGAGDARIAGASRRMTIAVPPIVYNAYHHNAQLVRHTALRTVDGVGAEPTRVEHLVDVVAELAPGDPYAAEAAWEFTAGAWRRATRTTFVSGAAYRVVLAGRLIAAVAREEDGDAMAAAMAAAAGPPERQAQDQPQAQSEPAPVPVPVRTAAYELEAQLEPAPPQPHPEQPQPQLAPAPAPAPPSSQTHQTHRGPCARWLARMFKRMAAA